jgi:hypothetical protein
MVQTHLMPNFVRGDAVDLSVVVVVRPSVMRKIVDVLMTPLLESVRVKPSHVTLGSFVSPAMAGKALLSSVVQLTFDFRGTFSVLLFDQFR